MRLSSSRLFALSVLALAIAAPAFADTIVSFGNASGTDVNFTGYNQGIYSVTPIDTGTNGAWVLNEAQGNPAPGISGGNEISAGGGLLAGASTSQFTVTDSGGVFDFKGLQLDTYGHTATYTFIGTLLGVQEFDVSSTMDSSSFANLFPAGLGADNIDTLTVTLTDNTASTVYAVDNIDLTPAPEPSSLILAGSGLLAAAAGLRRRIIV